MRESYCSPPPSRLHKELSEDNEGKTIHAMKSDLAPRGPGNPAHGDELFNPEGAIYGLLPSSWFRGRSRHFAQVHVRGWVMLVLVALALIGACASMVVGVSVAPSAESFEQVIKDHWWDILQFFLLILTAAGPVYLAAAAEERRLKNEGDFQGRVLVSLNQVQDDETTNGPVFCMRSLAEMSFKDFFPDDYVQWLVSRARDNVGTWESRDRSEKKFGPFLQFKSTYADWKRIRDHCKNRLSSLNPGGFLARDMGVPVVEVEYAWALT
jgi:hypothetical protein